MKSNLTVEFYSLEEAASALRMPEQDIRNLAESRMILSMELATGEQCFPQFQFDQTDLRGDLISLFQEFPEELTGWEIACWFYKTNEYLGDLPLKYIGSAKGVAQLKLLVNSEASLARLV